MNSISDKNEKLGIWPDAIKEKYRKGLLTYRWAHRLAVFFTVLAILAMAARAGSDFAPMPGMLVLFLPYLISAIAIMILCKMVAFNQINCCPACGARLSPRLFKFNMSSCHFCGALV